MREDSITVTLTGKDEVEWIRSKVRSGHCVSAVQVVSESVSTARHEEAALEAWLRDVIPARAEHLVKHPEQALTVDEVRRSLGERRGLAQH